MASITRTRAPTLGGGGYNPNRSGRSTYGKLAQVARGATYVTGIMERREHQAMRTARMESKAALHEAMFDLDADDATQGIAPEEKVALFDEIIEKTSGTLAESDREGAAELRMQGAIWRESLLGDDRKRWTERQEAEALDARARVLDQARSDLQQVAQGLLDPTDANAPARAAALSGTVKQRFEEAIADLEPHVQEVYRREFSHEASRLTVQSFLAAADDPADAYARLRSNRDEWVLPDGTSFNLSGELSDRDVETAIKADMGRRSDAHRMREQARIAHDRAKTERMRESVNEIKSAVFTEDMSETDVRALIADPSTPPEVAEGLETFLDQRGGRLARAASRDADQLRAEDTWLRLAERAGSPEELATLRSRVLDSDLDEGFMRPVLAKMRRKEQDLAQAQASGTTEQSVSFSRDWDVWETGARATVQAPGDVLSDRLGALEANPALKAQIDADVAAVKRRAEEVLLNSGGAARPFLDAAMPMVLETIYESRMRASPLGGRPVEPNAARWTTFMKSIDHSAGMQSLAAMDPPQLTAFLTSMGLVDERTATLLRYNDAGALDVSRTVDAYVRDEYIRSGPPKPENLEYLRRRARYLQGLREAARLAGGRKFLDEDPALMEASP